MMEQEADIALLPVAAVAEIGGLEVVPDPCIGANGRVESVVIVSQVPLDKVQRLLIDRRQPDLGGAGKNFHGFGGER